MPPVPHRVWSLPQPRHFFMEGESWFAVAVGVAYHEDAGTAVGSSNVSGSHS